MTRLGRPPRRARGAVMAEYILMASLIAAAAMTAARGLAPLVVARLQQASSVLGG